MVSEERAIQPGSDGLTSGFFHAGVTVSDLARSLAFYRDLLGLEVAVERVFTEPYILEIVAIPATALNIAILRIPGSDTMLELLEYQGVERHPGDTRPCDPGTGHFCLYTPDIEALHARLQAAGVKTRSGGPVLITAGPNKGSMAMYVSDPDGYNVEIFERRGSFGGQ